jgi:hypothetical protein
MNYPTLETRRRARRPFLRQINTILLAVMFMLPLVSHGNDNPPQKKPEVVFAIHNAIVGLDEFQELVKHAERLKPYGRVQINVGTLSEPSSYELPDTRSPWYDYASYNATPYKFFPHKDIAPFIPASHVEKNRKLLLAKTKLLRSRGLEASFFGSEPNFLPRAFFDAHPDLLGPRVDHPRRSNHTAFAPCVNHPVVRAMYTDMMAEMLKQAPEIKTYYFKTNDAGTGICWGDWLYTGPNGPGHCKHLSMGDRVFDIMSAFREGAQKAKTDLNVFLAEHQGTSNFSEKERADIQLRLPENCFFQSSDRHVMVYPSTAIVEHYPVQGIVNPFDFLNGLKPLTRKGADTYTVIVTARSWYSRGSDNPEGMKLAIDMIETFMEALTQGKSTETAQLVRTLSQKWGGASADALYAAFEDLHKTLSQSRRSVGSLRPINWNVAARHTTRPLVVAPNLLSPEEEAYFLPHVFNVSEEEARMDYIDVQGGRWSAKSDSARVYADKLKVVASRFAALEKNIPEKSLRNDLPLALRIRATMLRSVGNFADAQQIRDKNKEALLGEPRRPSKEPTWTGDEDLLTFNSIMRDELENTQELINALEEGGTRLVCVSPTPQTEDTFTLGPNLVEQLKMKRKIMLDHWRDIEYFMTTPFK